MDLKNVNDESLLVEEHYMLFDALESGEEPEEGNAEGFKGCLQRFEESS